MPGQVGLVVGLSGGGLCPEETEAPSWLEHMVSSVILEPVGHLSMKLLVKPGFFTWCSVVWLRLSSFWQTLAAQWAQGHKNDQRTAGPFRADCCPAGYPLHILSTELICTHKDTEETWLCVAPFHLLSFFAAFVSLGCLLYLDLVNRINGIYITLQ